MLRAFVTCVTLVDLYAGTVHEVGHFLIYSTVAHVCFMLSKGGRGPWNILKRVSSGDTDLGRMCVCRVSTGT